MLFKYEAITGDGKKVSGVYDANDKSEVVNMLRNNKYLPLSIERDLNTESKISFSGSKVKKKDLAVFCRQFYTMVNAGISAVKCFDILESQTENKVLKEALGNIHEDLQKGYTISSAMKKHNRVFPPILINMTEAGEASGSLDIILERMAVHFEKENKLENKIKGAMIYPIALIVVSIAVVVFMLVAVLPTFISMFEGSGQALPLPTRILLGFSNWLSVYWYVFLGIILTIILGAGYYRSTYGGRKFFDKLKIKIPGVKRTNSKIITSRFTRTLSTLMSSGIPLLQSLEIVGKVVNNIIIQEEMEKGVEDIRRGVTLSRVVKNIEVFPPMVDSMIKIGEESGALDDMLYKTADFYDEEVEASLQKMTTLIEPILLVFMAVVIGFIVISMAMPMFDMVNTI